MKINLNSVFVYNTLRGMIIGNPNIEIGEKLTDKKIKEIEEMFETNIAGEVKIENLKEVLEYMWEK